MGIGVNSRSLAYGWGETASTHDYSTVSRLFVHFSHDITADKNCWIGVKQQSLTHCIFKARVCIGSDDIHIYGLMREIVVRFVNIWWNCSLSLYRPSVHNAMREI